MSDCVGFVLKPYDNDPLIGSCTYFSSFDTVAIAESNDIVAVTTVAHVPTSTQQTCGADGSCSQHVQWAKHTGVYQNPEWYPGLSSSSTFDDFHQFFYEEQISADGTLYCAMPPCASG